MTTRLSTLDLITLKLISISIIPFTTGRALCTNKVECSHNKVCGSSLRRTWFNIAPPHPTSTNLAFRPNPGSQSLFILPLYPSSVNRCRYRTLYFLVSGSYQPSRNTENLLKWLQSWFILFIHMDKEKACLENKMYILFLSRIVSTGSGRGVDRFINDHY